VKIVAGSVKSTRRGDVEPPRRAYNQFMADVAFVLIIIAFFALAALFVRFCDSVIGADEEVLLEAPASTEREQRAA
jgi:hypothetical protein